MATLAEFWEGKGKISHTLCYSDALAAGYDTCEAIHQAPLWLVRSLVWLTGLCSGSSGRALAEERGLLPPLLGPVPAHGIELGAAQCVTQSAPTNGGGGGGRSPRERVLDSTDERQYALREAPVFILKTPGTLPLRDAPDDI